MAYRSSSIGTPANSTTHTVAVPAGLANGDKVNIFFIEEAGYTFDSNITKPSGFVMDATEFETASDFRPVYGKRYWKDITDAASEGSGGNYTFTLSAASIGYLVAVAHSGRATGAGTDAATNDGAAAASPISVPLTGVTAASGDDVIVVWSLAPSDANPATSSNTAPTNYTARQNKNDLWRIAQLATRDNVSAGATGTLTASSTFDGAATSRFTGLVIILPAGSSAPVLTSGTPTGTTTANPTVGCTTDTVANNIRFVIDTAANLDTVSEAQLIAGQNDTGSAAAYDSGAVAVTDTTPEFAFTGLANGTWTVKAIQYGGASNSNVLTWTITVAPPIDLAGPAGAESAATGALTTPTLVFNLTDIDNNSIKASITYSWVYVFSDDQNIVTYFSNVTTDALGVMRIRSDLINVPGATYHIMGFNADWSEKFHAHAVLADG